MRQSEGDHEDLNQFWSLGNMRQSFGSHYEASEYSFEKLSRGLILHQVLHSSSSAKSKRVVPNGSLEFLHLIDSNITGQLESMDKLKHIMSSAKCFGNEEEKSESIAFLIVDSFLGTMGGVESFEEDDADNPYSMMLNSRAAIVAGELIPWLPMFGGAESLMPSLGWLEDCLQ